MTQSDGQLLSRIAAGDERAFEALFERHGEAVRRHLQRMLRARGAADDVLQEVLLRVWTRAGQWHGQGAAAGWIFRIATNLALNHLRSERRRRTLPQPPVRLDEDDEDLTPGWMMDAAALGPDAVLELAEQRDLVRRHIADLPEEKREAIRLVYQEEMDIAEAAEAMGVPPGTVKSRLHYARKDLARTLRDNEENDT